MKRLLSCGIALLLSVSAYATTFNPIQLLNPAGSVAGQAIVSTGPTTVAAWGGVGVNGIAALAANTVLANATGSSASPTALAVPSCSTSSSALNWTTSGGSTAITCNTAINAATLSGNAIGTSGAAVPLLNGTNTWSGIQTFSTIVISGNDVLNYGNTSGQSIANNATATITNWTKNFDRVNANFNAATGIFTAPVTGFYHVDAGLSYSASTSTVVGNVYQVAVIANGATVCADQNITEITTSVAHQATTSCDVSLTSGQTVLIQAFQNSGAAVTLQTSGGLNYVSIHRIP